MMSLQILGKLIQCLSYSVFFSFNFILAALYFNMLVVPIQSRSIKQMFNFA